MLLKRKSWKVSGNISSTRSSPEAPVVALETFRRQIKTTKDTSTERQTLSTNFYKKNLGL